MFLSTVEALQTIADGSPYATARRWKRRAFGDFDWPIDNAWDATNLQGGAP